MRDLVLVAICSLVSMSGCGGNQSKSHDLAVVDQSVVDQSVADLASGDSASHGDLAMDLSAHDLARVDLSPIVDLAVSCDPSGTCADGPACGGICCGAGESCDGTTCHCGSAGACTAKGDTCHPQVGADNPSCGSTCCGGSTHPCLN